MESNKTQMMNSVLLEETKQLSFKQVPIPKPQSGEILVKIMAAPINPSDLAFLAGHYQSSKKFPTTPGFEGAGIVIASGGGVVGWSMVGKRVAVFGFKGEYGSYSQYAVVDSFNCVELDKNTSFEQGSMSFVNPMTALSFMEIAKDGGFKAVIHTAAASALGRMLNRLFISQKIPLINIVRRQQQVQLLKKEGATYVLNSQEEGFNEKLKKLSKELGATLAFDAIGGQMSGRLLQNMPRYARVELYGVLAGTPDLSKINAGDMLFNIKTIKGFHLNEYLKTKNMVNLVLSLKKLEKLLKNELKTEIAKQYPLEQIQDAVEYYKKNMTKGKVIVKPWLEQKKEIKIEGSK